jgi:phenylacetic acid degradation operon negative regulatory protein
MTWAGFATTTPGVRISPDPAAESDVAELLQGLELGAYSFVGSAGDIGDLNEVVRDAWHLDELAEEYRSFIDEFQSVRPTDGSDYFVTLVQLVHRWRRFPFIDPGLPATPCLVHGRDAGWFKGFQATGTGHVSIGGTDKT